MSPVRVKLDLGWSGVRKRPASEREGRHRRCVPTGKAETSTPPSRAKRPFCRAGTRSCVRRLAPLNHRPPVAPRRQAGAAPQNSEYRPLGDDLMQRSMNRRFSNRAIPQNLRLLRSERIGPWILERCKLYAWCEEFETRRLKFKAPAAEGDDSAAMPISRRRRSSMKDEFQSEPAPECTTLWTLSQSAAAKRKSAEKNSAGPRTTAKH